MLVIVDMGFLYFISIILVNIKFTRNWQQKYTHSRQIFHSLPSSFSAQPRYFLSRRTFQTPNPIARSWNHTMTGSVVHVLTEYISLKASIGQCPTPLDF